MVWGLPPHAPCGGRRYTLLVLRLLLLLTLPAFAQTGPTPVCPDGWRAKRQGACWTRTRAIQGGEQWAYVHPRGWLMDARCLQDARFKPGAVAEALEAAWKKLDPGTPVERGGCLSRFNPAWGKKIQAAVWDNQMTLSCPAFDAQSRTCATHEDRGVLRSISLANVASCLGAGGSGLAGILFHETLHGADVDNLPREVHNDAWELPQYKWIRDAVYGAEAVCFFGTDPAQRGFVNIVQCRGVVGAGREPPLANDPLCRDFSASFTDQRPMGFIKH